MATDIALRETIRFIRESERNVELAIAVRDAAHEMHKQVYGHLMGGVRTVLLQKKKTWHVAEHFPGKRKVGDLYQLELIRLYQKQGWTSKDPHGGVWFAHWDEIVAIGVEGFQHLPEVPQDATRGAIQNAFRGFDEFADDCSVEHHENWMGWKGVPVKRLYAMTDEEVTEFANRVARQMLDLARTIRATQQSSK